MADLVALAKRVKKAKGPDRKLDCLIEEWRNTEKTPEKRVMYYGKPTGEHVLDDGLWVQSPKYTSSFDAAQTLLLEGWSWSLNDIIGKLESVRMWNDDGGDILTSATSIERALTAACLLASAYESGVDIPAKFLA